MGVLALMVLLMVLALVHQPLPQRDRFLLVILFASSHKFGRSAFAFGIFRKGAEEDGSCHAGAHFVSVARQGKERRSTPQDVSGGRVRIALRSVEDEVADACT